MKRSMDMVAFFFLFSGESDEWRVYVVNEDVGQRENVFIYTSLWSSLTIELCFFKLCLIEAGVRGLIELLLLFYV